MRRNSQFDSPDRRRALTRLAFCLAALSVPVLSIAARTTPGRTISLKIAAANTPTVPGEPSFSAVGSMITARYFHTATLLNNGKVLIAGGTGPVPGGFGTIKGAELYDPATGTFTAVGDMITDREGPTATLLPNGKVLMTGGVTRTVNGNVTYLSSAELFDPSTGSFTAMGSMNSARYNHTATLLRDGRVLIVGGDHADTNATNNTAELFDPATGTFTLIANTMVEARSYHTTTLLQNGKVLIAGGGHQEGVFEIGTDTAELFDPATQVFTAAGVMSSVRYEHTATLLPNGKVLVAGGSLAGDIPVVGTVPTVTNVSRTADLFDPATGTFTQVSPSTMSSGRTADTATLLPNGKIIIAGGYNGGAGGPGIGAASWPNTVDIFDPSSNTFSPVTATMTSGRSLHTATVLADGRVLLAGGYNGSAVLNTAELADSSSGSFSSAQSMAIARDYHTATPLSNGQVLIAGGTGSTQVAIGTTELFDPATGSFARAAGTMISPRYAHTATLLADGKVLFAAGLVGTSLLDVAPSDTAELFDPDTQTFAATASLTSARVEHSATLLPNGKVLIAGGEGHSTYLKTAELFDPQSGTFTGLSNTMSIERHGHTATLLNNGKVLIAGGDAGLASLPTNTAEIFDPLTQTFTPLTSVMSVSRAYHTATLLPNGKVLLAGGVFSTSQPYYTETTDLFDPATNTFTAGPSMALARVGHSATLLPGGKVLIAAGLNSVSLPESNTAELYDPVLNTIVSVPSTMMTNRQAHTATLLPNGQVLIAGGFNSVSGYLNAAETFDFGLGFSDVRRPTITSATDPLLMPASLVLSGSGFRGDSEASGGMPQGSSTDYPVVQLMRIDNGQVFYPLSDPATSWSDTMFSSQTIGATDTLLPKGGYRVTVFTNGIPSIQKLIEISGNIVPLVPVTSIVSRKAHGDVAVFDVPLSTSGAPGIECRSGGTDGNYTIVFSFANTLTSVNGATVISGAGTVSSSWMSADMHQYIVNLTGVTNAQLITVSLSSVSDAVGNFSSTVSATMGVLVGDTNADGFVNSADISQTKSQSGQPVSATNFREDVNSDGFVNSADISLVKSKSGTALR